MKKKDGILGFCLRSACLAALLWFVLVPSVHVQAAGGLKVEEIIPLPTFTEPSYLFMELSYPQDWEKGSFRFFVDGRPAVFGDAGGGFGGGLNYAGFYLYVGEPGEKEIEIVFESPAATARTKTAVAFCSRGTLLLLDHYDGEAVFAEEPLRFLSCFFKECRVVVNGERQELQSTPITEGVSVLSCSPRLKPGVNSIEYAGLDCEGEEHRWTTTLFWAKDGRVKVGDRFKFGYGYLGSKSGPFFDLALEGTALVPLEEGGDSFFPTLDEGKWLRLRHTFFQSFSAKEKGTAIIKVFKKKHFLGGYELEREVVFTVEE
ncbi:MAG: hypothetical protein K6U03_02525 [Firmicutes bacterium]|nr:hypothetical protein [Bacillota bacterium]